ncbi:MAG: DUF3329 domain-containing protein, partial [Burkholderiales bacterium]|nr:DUF3329 domain-containing protein [Burkholderiales bacterium]
MLGLALALSVGVGLYFGAEWGWASALALLAGVGLYHSRNLRAIAKWLEHGEAPDPPRTFGIWDRLHALLHRSRRESARRVAELSDA